MGKKVISFCLWSDNPKYTLGAIKNSKLTKELFPDWEPWFYCGVSVPPSIMDMIENVNKKANIIWLSDKPGDYRMMFDRFRPIYNPDVEIMLSRDTDSRLSQREKDCVDEFLASPKNFHIIRDHPWHTTEILGGLWGAKKSFLPEGQFKQLLDEWSKGDHYQTDQEFLRSKIWPLVRYSSLIHDGIFDWGTGIPTPTARNGLEFLGETFDENDQPNQEHRQMLYKYLKGHGEAIRSIPDEI